MSTTLANRRALHVRRLLAVTCRLATRAPESARQNLDAVESASCNNGPARQSPQYSALFAVLVPFMALVNRCLRGSRGLTYAAHFVFLLHATAASRLILLPVYVHLNPPIAYFPAMLVAMAWTVPAAQRAFAVSHGEACGAIWCTFVPTMFSRHPAGVLVGIVSVLFIDRLPHPHPFARPPDLKRNAPVVAPGR